MIDRLETEYSLKRVQELASVVHAASNLAASISSGSFRTDGMIIAPCSMKTLASIRMGYSDHLISRAADVVLKERRKLVLLAREAPLSQIHLENMLMLSRAGAVILPPVLTFYNRPSTLEDAINHIVARTLDQSTLTHTSQSGGQRRRKPSRWGQGLMRMTEERLTPVDRFHVYNLLT